MNFTSRPRRGPAGRQAVIGAGLIVLLVASLAAVEGSMAHPRPLAQRWPAGPPVQPTVRPAAAAPGRVSDRAVAAGMRLLQQAATAARQTSYQGVQVISWPAPAGRGGWPGTGASTVTVDIWHRRGVGTVTRVTGPAGGTWSDVTDGPAGQPADGMLGLTPALIGLLGTHYAVLPDGTGSACGRPARIVEVLRADGSVAARFWLDRTTALPLRRELFDASAQVISDDGFDRLTLGSPAGAVSRSAAVRPWADQLGPAQLAALRAGGWPVPRLLPGDLTLFDASQTATVTGHVVDLAYSDGLSVVSLFVQRGQLPAALPGWHETGLDGNRLYVKDPGEPDLTWSAGGYVFTVVAAAAAATVAAAVNALPHQAEPGFWGRMKRGVSRLLSWLNPFG